MSLPTTQGALSKLKKKHFRVKHQKVKLFRANEPLLSVFMWGVNHTVSRHEPSKYILGLSVLLFLIAQPAEVLYNSPHSNDEDKFSHTAPFALPTYFWQFVLVLSH